jgi:hypothetical protein
MSSGDTETDAAAAMMFNHLRRPGTPFVTPEAVADFVDGEYLLILLYAQLE